MNIFGSSIKESTVTGFVKQHLLDQSTTEYFMDPKLSDFMDHIKQGQDIAAAKTYVDLQGSSIDQARLAVILAKTVN